ncbi:MAG: deoxyribonuclease IV [Candidatus Pacebacteria bacterium]|nr:deoxyribonuclease IV [Candidatus Paceibacterota bacterium]
MSVTTLSSPCRRPLGAHMSIAGGHCKAVERALRVGADALQVFTRNQVRWESPPLNAEEAVRFCGLVKSSRIRFVCAHASYLINLASPDLEVFTKSRRALIEELRRAQALGCSGLVLHPGSGKGDDPMRARHRLVDALGEALDKTASLKVRLLLENTAGQGAVLGASIEELGGLLADLQWPQRTGVCLDTAHLFAAGYDFRDHRKARGLLTAVRRCIGIEHIHVLHLNDSRHACGSRRDRHWHIGEGEIGRQGFANLLGFSEFGGIPGIIETPKGDSADLDRDKQNLDTLRMVEGQADCHEHFDSQ